uniref:Paraneoplastic antigen Ma-like C-terminal domain-containing protein n=1 Tax=Pundamilia nyererei TaxID=303518 RepID=A0A3B4FPR7_9CICH
MGQNNSYWYSFLQNEGKTLEDIQGLHTHGGEVDDNSEAIIRAVSELMVRTNKQPESHPYRCLRTFSRVSPTPAGEEALDTWLEQATLLVDEGECSDKEKRRRILESLKGPALEIIQAMQAIETIFGSVQSAEDLYLSFRALHQQPGEHLSEFLRRLERSLVKVVQGGGLPVSAANKARLEQLVEGSTSELMLLQLKIREQMENPPSFLNLLREVMEEEGRQAAKQSQTTSKCHQRVRTVQVEKEKESEAVTQSELQAQIQELRAQLEERNHSGIQPLSDCTFKPPTEKQKQKSDSQSEIRSLRKQVKALEHKMSVMAVKSTSDPPQEHSTQSRRHKAASCPKPASFKASSSRESDEYFCYKCGENGHIATSKKKNGKQVHPFQTEPEVTVLIEVQEMRVSSSPHPENP